MEHARFHDALRVFRDGAGEADALREAGPTLEGMAQAPERARFMSSEAIEGTTVRARRVFGPPVAGFAAFLDGTQQSRVLHYRLGLPVVFGTVAAVIRARINRRMVTWRQPEVRSALYLPKSFLPSEHWERAERAGFSVIDTTELVPSAEERPPIAHPIDLLERAVHAVQRNRERAEQSLAESWCAHEQAPLYIDGGVSKSDIVAASGCTVGVVKSHRTLYVDGDALRVVLGLRYAERSTVFRITSRSRNAVASWYLRVRAPEGRDPMWGLVRVEIAAPDVASPPDRLAERAEEVSRWVLAEATPLALPDARWDKMAYGIRDCEEFLRAIV